MLDARRAGAVALADFRQRVRSPRLVAVLLAVAAFGYLVTVGDVELVFQQRVDSAGVVRYQGVNNAPWVGLKAGLTGASILAFGGFYLFTGTLTRDRASGVGALAAATPVRNAEYLLGKWVSHVALGGVLVATLGAATIVNHAVHGVGPTDVFAILGPVVVLALPVAGLVGGVAVLFEANRWLDGTLGNVAYFVAAGTLPAVFIAADVSNGVVQSPLKYADVFGFTAVYAAVYDALPAVADGYAGGLPSFGVLSGTSERFVWRGGGWPAWVFGQRAALVAVGAGFALAGTVFFDRFAPGRRAPGVVPSLSLPNPVAALRSRRRDSTGGADAPAADVTLTPVRARDRGNVLGLYAAELRMALRGQPWWWYAGAVGLVAAGVLAPPAVARGVYLAALVWPLFAWSDLGVRPARHRTLPFVVTSRYPYAQLLAEWAAGVTVGLVVASGVAASFVAAGEFGALLGVAAAVTFPPALAVAAGIWSETSRVFELAFLVVWYVGPANAVPALDYAGVTPAAVAAGTPLAFLGLAALLVALALVRRHQQVP